MDFIKAFQPGHQLICHRHIRPKNDLEFWSYLARQEQWVHFGSAILEPPVFFLIFSLPIYSCSPKGDSRVRKDTSIGQLNSLSKKELDPRYYFTPYSPEISKKIVP
jgi:hypothetical protein